MYLFVDPSSEGSITLQLRNKRDTQAGKPSKTVPLHHSEELLGIIDTFLRSQNMKHQKLHGIVVVNAAPRFTTIRNVITVLNTMAWGLGIPIATQGKTLGFKPLKPRYSGPPRITMAYGKKVDKVIS